MVTLSIYPLLPPVTALVVLLGSRFLEKSLEREVKTRLSREDAKPEQIDEMVRVAKDWSLQVSWYGAVPLFAVGVVALLESVPNALFWTSVTFYVCLLVTILFLPMFFKAPSGSLSAVVTESDKTWLGRRLAKMHCSRGSFFSGTLIALNVALLLMTVAVQVLLPKGPATVPGP